jgi:hypothetical protein
LFVNVERSPTAHVFGCPFFDCNPRIAAFVGKKERDDRHNFISAASLILMSMPPNPPERLAEILLEILALSDSTRTSQSESVSGSDPIELFDSDVVKDDEGNNGQRP